MELNDRIRLAEAMGWTDCFEANDDCYGVTPEELQFRPVVTLPDPFTSAKADYQVLEWMRTHKKHNEFRLSVSLRIQTPLQYQIGDYARAALKVIE